MTYPSSEGGKEGGITHISLSSVGVFKWLSDSRAARETVPDDAVTIQGQISDMSTGT